MEEDILQVVKYCTDLIDDKDLEKLDLIIKYMKRWVRLLTSPTSLSPSLLTHPSTVFQAHAAVGGLCVEHGVRLHPGQRAGGGAADLR